MAGGVDYKDSNMQPGKPLPARTFNPWAAILLLWLLAGGSLFPVSSSGLKIEYDRWVRRSWTTEHGLPQNTVYALAQTNDGCLWIGSNGGLARFDGAAFTRFKKNATPGLGSDWITSLCPDRDGSLWIGTYGGGLVNHRAGKFKKISGLGSDSIWTICQDRDGVLWIGSADRGVYALEKGKLPALVMADNIPDLQVTAVGEDGEGRVWIGTRSGLLFLHGGERSRYSPSRDLAGSYVYCLFHRQPQEPLGGDNDGPGAASRRKEYRKFTTADGLADNLVLAVARTCRAGLDRVGSRASPSWSQVRGTPAPTRKPGRRCGHGHPPRPRRQHVGGNIRRRPEPAATKRGPRVDEADGLSSPHVRSVCEDSLGRLWVGTRDRGLNLFAGGEWRSFSRRDGLASDAVTSLLRRSRRPAVDRHP